MAFDITEGKTDSGMHSCQCGICGHRDRADCLKKECVCCLNFHIRSGPKVQGHRDPA